MLCPVFQGLRLGPKRRGSVVGTRPNSGVLVLPTWMSAGGLLAAGELAVDRRDPILEELGAGGLPCAGVHWAEVLDQERYAGEGSGGYLAVGGAACVLVKRRDHGVELRVQPLDALDGGLHELDRLHLLAADKFGLCGGVQVCDVVHR